MMFPFFTIFLLFLALLTYNRVRIEKKERAARQEFWQREEEANSVRRKDISSLPYIIIPIHELPFGIRPEDEILSQCETDLHVLAQEKILNLTGRSNTDLKLAYGAPNLSLLTQYDQNFTQLVRTMQRWGLRLHELSLDDEAEQVLALSVKWGSDIKATYLLLAQLYQASGRSGAIQSLAEQASRLNTLMKEPILAALKEF